MVKSRYNTFASLFCLIAIIFFFLIFLYGSLFYFLDINVFSQTTLSKEDATFRMSFGIIGLILFCTVGSFKVKKISINAEMHRIIIKNFITQQSLIYNFSDLDGYQDMIINHGKGGTSYKVIALIKDNKVLFKIDSFYYSNLDELRSSIKELKYLGINIDWNKQKF